MTLYSLLEWDTCVRPSTSLPLRVACVCLLSQAALPSDGFGYLDAAVPSDATLTSWESGRMSFLANTLVGALSF